MGRIAVLGSSGMLGSALTKFMSESFGEVIEFNRSGQATVKGNIARTIDVSDPDISLDQIFANLDIDYAINAIGLIKQLIFEDDPSSVRAAKVINSEFPKKLQNYSNQSTTKIIQIGTDCVYSGLRGSYTEEDEFDPDDVYGKTKADGELNSKNLMTIRCSIIGREPKNRNSLIEWVLSRPKEAKINGYTNHLWNGVTTLGFAKVVSGVIKTEAFQAGEMHLVPKNEITKFNLVKSIAGEFGRTDIEISEYLAPSSINRTLDTIDIHRNTKLWELGGYNGIPTIEELLRDYVQWSMNH
jgi:dTDP-4-dehydrorhamnose reductase